MIIMTDGNQTLGVDYRNLKSQQPIFPIVFGDTTNYKDISISQLNVNKYTYVGNQFPVVRDDRVNIGVGVLGKSRSRYQLLGIGAQERS